MQRCRKMMMLGLVLLFIPMISNCGASGGGGGITNSDAVVAEQLIRDGWSNIQVGNLETARANFIQAIDGPLTDAQRVAANAGMGWSLSKNGKILEAIPYFEIAAVADNEAKVGLAGALIFRHQTTEDYRRAATLLGNMPPEKFAAAHAGLGLNSAKVHALTAVAYALAGEPQLAKTYMNKAAAIDSTMVGTTVDRIDDAFQMLGWKD